MKGRDPPPLERRSTGIELPRLDIEEWREEYGVIAGITGSDGGFDLALWGGDCSGEVLRRWQVFMKSFEPNFRQAVVGHQYHGTNVEVCAGLERGLLVKWGVDGHVTNSAGLLLSVLVADCVPVYLLHPETMTIGLLHAGWRGTAAGILESGVRRLESLGVTRRSEILMHCGVSICGDCYEVGPEVFESVSGMKTDERGTLDLREVLVQQGKSLGLEMVSASSWCTVHDAGLFHSHRSLGERAGRMAAYLGVPLG